MQPFSAAQYKGRSATGFRKAAPTTQTEPSVTEVPAWRPPVQEKPMRLPALKDTTRFVELIASVAQQQEQREDFKDIHDDEWLIEGKLKEALGKGMRLLEFDVGPKRALRGGAAEPWQALSKEEIGRSEGSMGDWPDRIDWGDQEVLTEMVQRLMPGQWHEGHRTILSRKCAEQQANARMLKGADLVPAMQQDEVEKRGDVAKMTRVQVKNASMLHWGLELVMTVPKEVDRLAKEVNWSRVTRVWDPWAGTGVIGSVLKGHWDHLKVMNNDWNPQLKWPEAMNALQPGDTRDDK
ncbi:hypothetical protein CYMTET_12151 [Cymbomonas tetramitiformis]|uniref:Uncharacterized protein n=1 Tax=Cymbomonas tetramitiformis TaxID=36881 RepID=A0AAE0LCC5_9CHLO|nr:hypothetical protein CYMTET_12151 [Cymbomonas tetramitiformis]